MHSKIMPFSLPDLFHDLIQKDPSTLRIEFWLIFNDSKLLVDQNTFQPFQTKNIPLKHARFMGTYQDLDIHIGEAVFNEPPQGAVWFDIKKLYGKIDDPFLGLAGRAVQLISWDRTHQYCGQCGNKTVEKLNERVKECPSCKLLTYPKICPVIMALIQKGDEILLARGVHFPAGFYSALAGFVDAGETLEQCIRREVFEEVGLQIENIQYFSSQSWPFPNSLMIAFTCQWKSGEITIDPSEILDAQWFKKIIFPFTPGNEHFKDFNRFRFGKW